MIENIKFTLDRPILVNDREETVIRLFLPGKTPEEFPHCVVRRVWRVLYESSHVYLVTGEDERELLAPELLPFDDAFRIARRTLLELAGVEVPEYKPKVMANKILFGDTTKMDLTPRDDVAV